MMTEEIICFNCSNGDCNDCQVEVRIDISFIDGISNEQWEPCDCPCEAIK